MDHMHLTIKEIIKNMLYSFGNTPEIPTEEAIDITEKIVFTQLQMLLKLLYQTAEHFESNEITHREFLFLLRHNEIKIHRLLRFLEEKDLLEPISKTISQNPSLEPNIIQSEPKKENIYHSNNDNNIVDDNNDDDDDDDDDDNDSEEEIDKTEKEFLKRFGPRKRLCYEYLSDIIPEWFPKWYNREIPLDATKQRRMIRFDMMSLKLDTKRYLTFSELRRTSFREFGQQGFQLWLGKFKYPFANDLAYEMLYYFAKEIVFELVDMTLLYASNMVQSRGVPVGSKELNPGIPHEIPTVLTGNLINNAFELYTLSRRPNKRILVL